MPYTVPSDERTSPPQQGLLTLSRLRRRVTETHTPEGDLALVRGVRARDPESLECFSKRLRCIPLCLRALNSRAGRPLDEHDLADVVQDTTMVVLRKLDVFDGRATLDGWLYRLCQLELYNAIRSKRRRPRPVEDETVELVLGGRQDPTRESRMASDIQSGLSTLEESERDVVRLKHFANLTFEVIGDRLGMSPNTAKTRYYRGLKKLQQFMEPRRKEYRA